MRFVINLARYKNFEYQRQLGENYCIPACIENALTMLGETNWNQNNIVEILEIEKKSINGKLRIEGKFNFNLVLRIIRETDLKEKFDSLFLKREDFENNDKYLNFIDNYIKKNIPVIISIDLNHDIEIIDIRNGKYLAQELSTNRVVPIENSSLESFISEKISKERYSIPFHIDVHTSHSILIIDKEEPSNYEYYDPSTDLIDNLTINELLNIRSKDWNISVIFPKN